MYRIFFILAGSVCFLLMSNLCAAQSVGLLTISAANFGNNKGKAVIHLFRKEDDMPGKPFMESTAAIVDGKAMIVFQNIAYGDYAAILFQDENANGKLDHRFGFPNEPMGFSNEWNLTLFSGMPTFSKLKFQFSESKTNLIIAIR